MTKAVSNIHDGFFNGKSLVFSSTIEKIDIGIPYCLQWKRHE